MRLRCLNQKTYYISSLNQPKEKGGTNPSFPLDTTNDMKATASTWEERLRPPKILQARLPTGMGYIFPPPDNPIRERKKT